MAQTIKLKNSGTSGNTPSSLVHGELALNYADGKLFYKNSSNSIVELSTAGSFLPLSGGTLTGALTGTSITTSGNIRAGSSTGNNVLLNNTGSIEITRANGAFVDFKTDNSEDFDGRIIMDASNNMTFHTRTGSAASAPAKFIIQNDGNVKVVNSNFYVNTGSLYVGTGDVNESIKLGHYSSSESQITGLVSGSTFGSLITGATNGHIVVALRDNDVGDSFSVISGSGNYMSDSTFDKKVFSVRADGAATFSDTISSGAITADTGGASQNVLNIGGSSATNYTIQRWLTSAHSGNEAYILAYGASHSSEAGNFAIKNLEANSDIFFELAGSVEPLRLTSTGAAFPDGSTSAPAIRFASDSDTGLIRSGTDELRIVTGGGIRGTFSSAGIFSSANVYSGTTGAFRNFSGTWAGTTGTANNGFYFLNTANSNTTKAMELSHDGNVVFAGTLTATKFIQSTSVANTFYAGQFSRSGSTTTTPDIWGTNSTFVIGTSSTTEALAFSGANAEFYGTLETGRTGINTAPVSDVQLKIQTSTNDSSDLAIEAKSANGNSLFMVRGDGISAFYGNYVHFQGGGTGMYVENNAVFRGNIANDSGNLHINDSTDITGVVTATSNINTTGGGFQINGTTVINSSRHINLFTSGSTGTEKINLARGGRITFYGDTSAAHSIGSRDLNGAISDDIRINTYGGLSINLDSNDNNSGNANFTIGRHGGGTGTISELLTVSGETGNVSVTGTVDGRDVAADGTKLDTIATNADVTPSWVPSSDPSYATQSYVGTAISNLVDSAPSTLDTLNELASALNDDANFSTTVTNSIATKLPLAGGTLTGTLNSKAINMQNHQLYGVNNLRFNDPGVNEGIKWDGGNEWQIYESPDNQTNASGNLQFTTGSGGGTLKATLDTSGNFTARHSSGTTRIGQDGNYGNYGSLGFGGHTNGSNRVFGHYSTGDGLYLASATGRGVFIRTNGGNANNFEFTSGGDLKVAGSTFVTSGKEIQNASVAASSSIAPRFRGTASVNNSGYVHAFRVDGDNLASTIRFTVHGTTGSVVVNSDIFVSVNHYHDIFIESNSGFYTVLTVKVVSNGNEDFSVYLKTNSANTATVQIEVYPLNNETITFTSTDQGFTTKTLEHTCDYGKRLSAEDNVSNRGFDIETDGQIDALKYQISGTTVIGADRSLTSINSITSGGNINTTSGGFQINGATVIASNHRITPFEHVIFGSTTGYIQHPSNSSANAWAYGVSGGGANPGVDRNKWGLHYYNGTSWSNPFYVDTSGNAVFTGEIQGATLDINGNADVTGQVVIVGPGTSSSTIPLNIKDNNANNILRVRDDGVVLIEKNYLYVTSAGGAYVQNSLRARGGITNDQGNDLSISSGSSQIDFNSKNFVDVGDVTISKQSPLLTLETTSNSTDPEIRLQSNSAFSNEGFGIYYDNSVGEAVFQTTYTNNAASLKFHTATGGSPSSSNLRLTIGGDGNFNFHGGNLTSVAAINTTSTISAGSTIHRGNLTIDSQEIDVGSGDLTLDVAGNITLDAGGGNIDLKEGGTTFGRLQEMIGGLGISAGSSPTFAQLLSPTKTLFFGHIELGDSKHVRWGNGNGDLQIYHDGSNSYIEEYGTGDLIISSSVIRSRTDEFLVTNAANNATLLQALNGSSVFLYHDNDQKFRTHSYGGALTGNPAVSQQVWSGGNQTASAPAYAFNNDTNTGMFRASTDALGFSTGGTERLRADSGGVRVLNGNFAVLKGNTSNTFTDTQIKFGYANSQSYQQAIKTRHNSGTGHGNAIDFFLWDSGTDAVGAIGTKRVASFETSRGLNITHGGLQIDSTDVINSGRALSNITGATISGDTTITGSGSTGNAFKVNRGNNGNQSLRVQNTGEIVTAHNYLYASFSGTAFYSQGRAVFRTSISNDQGDLKIEDNLNITGSTSVNGTQIISSSRALSNVTGNVSMFTNDAGYLTSHQSLSGLLPLSGGTMTGTITSRDILLQSNYHLMRSNHHSGHLEGGYNNIGNSSGKTSPIFTIGSSYNPNDSTLGNMYGVGFSHINASFISFTGGGGWGMYVAADGDARVWLDGSNGVISSTGQHYVGSNVVWNAGNDGSGSGLDADTLDSLDSSQFVRSDTSDTMLGNYTIDNGTNTTLTIKCDDGGTAIVKAHGDIQGTGAFEVGQSTSYGGGISYNGDGSPSFVSGETDDHITFYRLNQGTRTEVFHYPYNSNVVNFNATPTVGGVSLVKTSDTIAQATNAGALDNLDSSQFLRSDADDSVTGNKKTTLHQLRFTGVGTNSNAGNDGYAFYQEAGAWSNPFPDLLMGYHTGVKFGAHKSYGGIRFYNDHPYTSSATKIFSVGEGDNNVRIQLGNLYFSSTTNNKAWHAGNDGSGSSLDADTVDGVHASSLYGVTSVATGGGLTGGTITSTGTISHADTSSVSNVNNSGNTFIQDITFDTYGHVTSVTSATATSSGGGGASSSQTVTARVKANRLDYIAATSPATIFTATSGKVIVLEEAICFIDADAVSASGYPVFGYPIRVRVKSQWNSAGDPYIHRDGGMTFTKEALNSLFRSNSQSANYSANMKRFLVAQPRDPTAPNPDMQQQIAEVNSSDGTFNSKIELTMDSYVNTSTSEDYYFYFQVKFREVTLSDITGASGMVTI